MRSASKNCVNLNIRDERLQIEIIIIYLLKGRTENLENGAVGESRHLFRRLVSDVKLKDASLTARLLSDWPIYF